MEKQTEQDQLLNWFLKSIFMEFKESESGILSNAFKLPPEEAIAFLKAKGMKITWSWKDLEKDAHAKSFTVAKAMKQDILLGIKDHLQKALNEGWSLKKFQETLAPELQKKGWWGQVPDALVPTDGSIHISGKMAQLGSMWRLKTIFQTNVQSAMMAGRYKAMKTLAEKRPFWQYLAIMDSTTRPEHAALHGRIFRHDDPVWSRIYPPNGFNCRCSVRSLSDKELETKGLVRSVEESNSGKIFDSSGRPIEPDPGFDYNPGEAGAIEIDKLLKAKQERLQKDLKTIKTTFFRPTQPEEEIYVPRIVADPEEIAPQILPTQKEIELRKKIHKDKADTVALVDKTKKALPEKVLSIKEPVELDDFFNQVDLHAAEPTWDLEKSKSKNQKYGGIIFNDEGKILLRRPTGDFDGYVWTFAKGGASKNDKPLSAAKREVAEETGYQVKTVGFLPGGFGNSKNHFYFVMKADKHLPETMDKETQDLKWVTPHEAVELVSLTTNKAGKLRDLQALVSAVRTWNGIAEGSVTYDYLKSQVRPRRTPEEVKAVEAQLEAGRFPETIEKLKVVSKLGGSTGAQLVMDPETGRKFVMKKGAGPDHIREEVATDKIYRAMNIRVPDCKLYETSNGPVKLAEFIEGAKPLSEVLNKPAFNVVKAQLQKGFSADALLGNWDVCGLGFDNVLVDPDGNAWRIDNGGSLRFRAQGKLKSDYDWNEYCGELWTLRGKEWKTSDSTKNGLWSSMKKGEVNNAAQVFGDLPFVEIARQIESWDESQILKEVPDDLQTLMKNRIRHMKDIAKRALDFENDRWSQSYIEDIAQGSMALRKYGFQQVLPKTMSQVPGDVYVYDEDGKLWDKLIFNPSQDSSNETGDPFYSSLLPAAKTIGYHKQKGDNQYNIGTIKSALTIAEKLKASDPELLAHYKPFVEYLEESYDKISKGLEPPTPPKLKPFEGKQKKAEQKIESASQRIRALAEDLGVNLEAIRHWQKSQGGSSWSTGAMVRKYHTYLNSSFDENELFWHGGKSKSESAYRDYLRSNPTADLAIKLHHAAVQELLSEIDFRFNDRERRCVRIIRTESSGGVIKEYALKKGQEKVYPRGLNESGSVFSPVSVYGSEITLAAIPYSRITGTYIWESPTSPGSSTYLGPGENEFTHCAPDIPVKYIGRNQLDLTGGKSDGRDASEWGVSLNHLRSVKNK